MNWLNYHHLLYFHTVAREGSVVRAAQLLHLTQPTVSGQIKTLEDALGERLFDRVGRRLVLTDVGGILFLIQALTNHCLCKIKKRLPDETSIKSWGTAGGIYAAAEQIQSSI